MTSAIPPGWYPDPSGAAGILRWWDGLQWTGAVHGGVVPSESTKPALAEYGPRLGGWLLDFVIMLAVTSPILWATGSLNHTNAVTYNSDGTVLHSWSFGYGLKGILIQTAVVIVYGTAMCGWRGQTIGMMATHVRVVDRDSWQRLGYGRAFVRALIECVLFAALVVPWVVDMLSPLWDGDHQTLHDKAGHAVVVRSAP